MLHSNFDFSKPSAMSFIFKDLSYDDAGLPISNWLWNFGDGSTSTVSSPPPKTYSTPGIFLLSLQVTNSNGTSIKSVYLTIDATRQIISLPIIEQIKSKIPVELFNYITITHLVQKWQAYLQPQIDPIPIPEEDMFNETKWPTLANALISELCVYDIMIEEMGRMALRGSVIPTGSAQNNNEWGVKSIEVGPSKTEWWDSTSSSANFFKAAFSTGSSLFSEYKGKICTLAQSLKIQLPICKKPKVNLGFVKAGRSNEPSLNFTQLYPNLKLYE